MAFTLSQTASYKWPVTLSIPADGGKFDKFVFDAEFRRLSQTRIREIGDAISAGDSDDPSVAREILCGWSGINDEQGKAIPFSEKAMNDLLDIPMVATFIMRAWFASLKGAKVKN
jgi:hypothetical protein